MLKVNSDEALSEKFFAMMAAFGLAGALSST
jgi:hypothetical protein